MTEYLKQEPVVCHTCDTMPMESHGVFSCGCSDKVWSGLAYPSPIQADAETTILLNQKGFDLAPCGWYYVNGGDLTTIFSNGHWQLESLEHEQPTIKSLKEYLLTLPDRASPAS